MQRYYFHVRHHEMLIRDPEGAEFETLEMARDEAVQAAREILAERLIKGDVIDGEVFEISLEDGAIVATIPFRDMVRLETGKGRS
jgi:hypothetical protein